MVPDVMIVDVEMPRMDGITFLRKIMDQCPIPTIICSSHTAAASGRAFEAARAGAVEVLEKPTNLAKNQDFTARLVDAVKTASIARVRVPVRDRPRNSGQVRLAQNSGSVVDAKERPTVKSKSAKVTGKRDETVSSSNLEGTALDGSSRKAHEPVARRAPGSRIALIAIGASTGGTEAIRRVLAPLPVQMPPIVIVQHMPPGFTASFANWLDSCCKLQILEAVDGRAITSGQAVIAKGGQHLRVRVRQGQFVSVLGTDAPVNRHRPSVDALFDSVVTEAGARAHGILLTGMGDDGANGLLRLRQIGAMTIAESEESAVVFGMPKEAIARGAAAMVLGLDEISSYLGSVHFDEVT
jgi:two-component system chemotaxis response regulator CheB